MARRGWVVPRDREGGFEPALVKKGQTRIGGIDDKVVGPCAASPSVRDIQAHREELDGLRVSPDLISRVADAFPEALVQTCIVHLIRHPMNFRNWKDRKRASADLRRIYEATNAETAAIELEAFEAK